MTVGQAQSAQIGFYLFDMWMAGLKKVTDAQKPVGSPLVAAVCKEFEAYLDMQNAGNQALIKGLAGYCLNPGGQSVVGITAAQMAPMLALNVIA